MGRDLRNAIDFFQKYGLDQYYEQRIDHDLTQEGVQNDSVNIDELVADYRHLPPAERYAVFVRLQRGGDDEVLKLATGFAGRKKPFDESVTHLGDAFNKVIADIRRRIAGKKDLWEKRIETAEGIFAIDMLLASLGAAGLHNPLKAKVKEGLETLYLKAGPALFDTDGDFDPYAKRSEWGYAFDDKDVLPLDGKWKIDRDGDGIADGIDKKPADRSAWTELKIGEEVKAGNYTVRRVSENEFEISLTIRIAPDPEGNTDNIRETLMNPGALAERKKWIEEAFSLAVEKGKHKFKLNVNFEAVDNGNAEVLFSDRDIRSHVYLWGGSLLYSPAQMLHEVFHILGWPDYYHEPNVDEGIRDFTTKPGYGVLGKKHLMACVRNPVIPQKMLLNMAAESANNSSHIATSVGHAGSAERAPSEPIRHSILYEVPPGLDGFDLLLGSKGDWDKEELKKRLLKIESAIAVEAYPPKKDALLFAKGVALIMLGNIHEGNALLMEIFGRNKDDDNIVFRICNILIETNDVENALAVAKYKLDKTGGDFDRYIYAKVLYKAGRYEEAVPILEGILQKADSAAASASRSLWIDALIKMGDYKKLDDYISAMGEGHMRRYAATVVAARIAAGGDLAKAKEVFFRYPSASADHSLFISAMRKAGLKSESIEWFMQYIFPHLDYKKNSDIITLRLEARWLAENGFAGQSLPIYNLLLKKDPYNIDYNLNRAIALFARGENKEAIRALEKTAEAYDYMDVRGLTQGMSWDAFVEVVRKNIEENKFQTSFVQGMEEIENNDPVFHSYKTSALLYELLEKFAPQKVY